MDPFGCFVTRGVDSLKLVGFFEVVRVLIPVELVFDGMEKVVRSFVVQRSGVDFVLDFDILGTNFEEFE